MSCRPNRKPLTTHEPQGSEGTNRTASGFASNRNRYNTGGGGSSSDMSEGPLGSPNQQQSAAEAHWITVITAAMDGSEQPAANLPPSLPPPAMPAAVAAALAAPPPQPQRWSPALHLDQFGAVMFDCDGERQTRGARECGCACVSMSEEWSVLCRHCSRAHHRARLRPLRCCAHYPLIRCRPQACCGRRARPLRARPTHCARCTTWSDGGAARLRWPPPPARCSPPRIRC